MKPFSWIGTDPAQARLHKNPAVGMRRCRRPFEPKPPPRCLTHVSCGRVAGGGRSSRRAMQPLFRIDIMGPDSAVLETSDITAQRDGPAGLVRCLPVGAEPQPGGGVHFRVWAPRVQRI